MFDDYKEEEGIELTLSKIVSQDTDITDEKQTVSQVLADKINVISKIYESQDIEGIITSLIDLKRFCKLNFSLKEPLEFDYKSNVQVLLNFLDNPNPDICGNTLKVLIQFAKFYKESVKNILDNALLFFPFRIFTTIPNVDYKYTIILIDSIIAGLSVIVDENEIEKTNFNLSWLIHDIESFFCSEEEEEFDIDKYLIKCLKLILELAKHQWPMDVEGVEQTFEFINIIFTYFAEVGLGSKNGSSCCDLIIQIFSALITLDPENIKAQWIIDTCCKIEEFYFFDDSTNGDLNLTFASLLYFFISCAQKVSKETAIEIYDHIGFNEIMEYAGDETNSLISLPATLFCVYYLKLLPEKCAAIYQNEISIMSEKLFLLLIESKLQLKKLAINFFDALFQKSDLFDEICRSLIEKNDFLSILFDCYSISDNIMSKVAINIMIEIAKKYNDYHSLILEVLQDSIYDDELEQLKFLLSDVIED